MLNEYFELMVDVIFKYEGTLDKFVGDEIIALFGAPVAMPEAAAGMMTPSVTLHCGAPRASAPSRKLCGTSRIISSVVRATIGIMISARAMPPASAEKCFIRSTTTP